MEMGKKGFWHQEFTREEFLHNVVSASAVLMGLSLFRPLIAFAPEQESSKPTKRSLIDALGIHDTPNVGGSLNVDVALKDIAGLNGHSLVAINPSEHLLKGIKAQNLTVIARIYQPGNRFKEDLVKSEAEKVFNYVEDPIFQTNNEVNLLKETGGVFVSPKAHVEEQFLPAVSTIIKVAERYKRRAQILITPFAQDAPVISGLNEEAYFSEVLDRLAPHVSALNCDFRLGLHGYVFKPGEDPLEYVQKRVSKARSVLGVNLPINITEAGLHLTADKQFTPEIVADETCRILQTPIPDGLLVDTYNLWVGANFAQRPREDQSRKDLQNFEPAALRRLDGVSPTYQQIAELVASW